MEKLKRKGARKSFGIAPLNVEGREARRYLLINVKKRIRRLRLLDNWKIVADLALLAFVGCGLLSSFICSNTQISANWRWPCSEMPWGPPSWDKGVWLWGMGFEISSLGY